MRLVENALSRKNINAQNLNLLEIDNALRTGRLAHVYNPGGGVKLDADTRALLMELQHLRRQQNRVRQYQQANGGLKNTAKTWVRESVQDSDVYTGYTFAKKAQKVTATSFKAGKVGLTGAANGTVNAIAGTQKIALNMQKLSNNIRLNPAQAVVENAKLTNRINVINKRADSAKVTITNTINPRIGTKVKNAVSVGVNNGIKRVFPWLRPLQNRFHGNVVMKILKSPFSLLNGITRFVKKWAFIILGGLLLILIVLIAVTSTMSSLFPSSVVEIDESAGETAKDSNAQKMMEFLYSYQEAYTENLFEADATSRYVEKSIPESWRTQIIGSDPSIDSPENNASVYTDDDEFVGFNFFKYWGQRAWQDGVPTTGADAVGEIPLYRSAITGTWEIGGEDGETDYQSKTVYLEFYGNAGLSGNIGDYHMDSIKSYYNLDGDDDTILKYDINGGEENPGTHSDAYDEWAEKLNPDVECTFNYQGSRYTFTVTGDKYSRYYDREGHSLHDYDIDTFYKGFLTVALGFTDNDLENADFYTLYCKEIFDAIIDRADVSMYYTYEHVDTEENLKINMYVGNSETPVELTSSDYYKCKVHCDVVLRDCGLMDMIYVDSILTAEEPDKTWTHYGLEGNEWAHWPHIFKNIEDGSYDDITDVRSTGQYSFTDPMSEEYVYWFTEQRGENTNPLWGMTKAEKDGEIPLVERTYNADGLLRTYSGIMETCIEYYGLTVEDWEVMVEGLEFPSGWARTLNDAQIAQILEMALDFNPSDFAINDEYLQYVLSTIGKYSYSFGAGHGGISYDTYNGRSLDCSAYISLLMQAAGKLPSGTVMGTSSLKSYFGATSYNGDATSLSVGDLVFKTGRGSNSANNDYDHVAMYVGVLQLEGDSEPRPYFVECTSKKGTILSPASRFSSYKYVSKT